MFNMSDRDLIDIIVSFKLKISSKSYSIYKYTFKFFYLIYILFLTKNNL